MGPGRLGHAGRGRDANLADPVGHHAHPAAADPALDLAGRVATLDSLSDGRVQLSVGLGALHPGWLAFERDEGRKVRAKKLDEGLAIYDGLMRGQPFAYAERTTRSNPPTSSRPHRRCSSRGSRSGWSAPIPRDCPSSARRSGTGSSPRRRDIDANPFIPDDLRRVVSAVKEIREAKGLPWEGYDVVAEGVSVPGARGNAMVADWVEAGATFWVESDWSMGDDAVDRHRRRIDAGPPSLV